MAEAATTSPIDLGRAASFSRLTLRGVRKAFGRQAVLRGVDTDFEGGRTALLMGPNGAGKSTLLNILSTSNRPSGGEVLYGDHPHRDAEILLRHRIGLVTHAPLLYPDLSIRENLLFFARLYGVPRAPQAVEEWIAHVDLERAQDREIRLLSHGMKQRVALGRALMHGPDLLLLDEPFTGLDRSGVELLRRELARQRAAGKIVIVVTHDVDAIDGLCDQLVVLSQGQTALDHRAAGLGAREILERYNGAI